MQRLTVENGKLVAYTDNGKIADGITSTDIHGEFIVDSVLVKSLIAEQHVLPLYYECWKKGMTKDCRFVEYMTNVRILNSDAVVDSIIKKHVEARKTAEERYEKLLQAIDRFNKERRFYEREFKLD